MSGNVIQVGKGIVKKAILRSRVLANASRVAKVRIAVLKYHSIQDNREEVDESIGGGLVVPTAVFRKQMEIIARKFNVVSMDDVIDFLKDGKRLPRRPVAITFDDGYADNFAIAAPILDDLGLPATFYITVGSAGKKKVPWFIRLRHATRTTTLKEWKDPDNGVICHFKNREDRLFAMRYVCKKCAKLGKFFLEEVVMGIEKGLGVDEFVPRERLFMSWEEIRKLHKAGHIIGSHTLSHMNVAYLEDDDLAVEIDESKRILEKELMRTVIHFSYPNPALDLHFTYRTMNVVQKAGYETSVISRPSGAVSSLDNPLSLRRVWVPLGTDGFMWNLEAAYLGLNI